MGGRQIKAGYQYAKHILRTQAIAQGKSNPELVASQTIVSNIKAMIVPYLSQSSDAQNALKEVQNESDLVGFAKDFPSLLSQVRMHLRVASPREFEYILIHGPEKASQITVQRVTGVAEYLSDMKEYNISQYEKQADIDPSFKNYLDQKFQQCVSDIDVSKYDPAIASSLQQSLTDIRRS